ncbi:MAG: RNA 2',3'-cyclic phosphodiesterase [Actinobacteria bacterium]|nr:MAG: RNA 2',3'-cyclic phosphodiesterase [Actinomycetota bacterium]
MNSTGSVGSDASIRLFCALRLPDDVLDGLVAWGVRALPERGGVRRVVRANLHVTLAFLGRRPARDVPAVAGELREAAAAARPARFAVARYRETRSVGMLVLDDEDGRSTALADDLHRRLERLGVYERERRPWLPHLTVVRFRERPRLAPPLPALGAFGPSDAALYHSVLRSTGAQYEVLETFALGGT